MDQTLLPLQSELSSTQSQTQSQTREPGSKWARSLLFLAVLALVLYLNLPFLMPIVMGAVLAAVMFPLMSKFDRTKFTKRFPRALRAAIITVVFLLVILIPFGLLIFAGVQQVIIKIQTLNVQDFTSNNLTFAGVINTLGLKTFMNHIYDALPISPAQAQAYLTRGLAAAAAFGGNVIQSIITTLPGTVLETLVMVFTLFFLLLDGPKALSFVRTHSMFNRDDTNRLLSTAHLLANSVILATIISGAVQASIVAIICFITGTSNPILFAFLTFLCSFLPVLGTSPVMLFLIVQAFAQGSSTNGIIWLVGFVIVSTSDNFVRPYVIRGGAELHPLIAFVSAFGGLSMLGFYGLFIGPIVAGLFFTLIPMISKGTSNRSSAR